MCTLKLIMVNIVGYTYNKKTIQKRIIILQTQTTYQPTLYNICKFEKNDDIPESCSFFSLTLATIETS